MKLVEIKDEQSWEKLCTSHTWSQFTQSWAWGEFREQRGGLIRRFALIEDTGECVLTAQLEYRKKRFVGGYWFAPRGPVFHAQLEPSRVRDVFATFIQLLSEQRLERSLFWRFEPLVEIGKPEGLIPMRLQRNDAQNPASTIVLNLEPSQEELLAAMHQKTRYNIRVAAKHGVTTRIASQPGDVTAFLNLMNETAARDGFVQHDASYLKATYDFLSQRGLARIRLAEYQGRVLAANLEVMYGDTVTYLYGSSSSEARHLMAPFALHWDAIQQAKRDGYRCYDFWGANPESKAAYYYKPAWEGITRFKRGWGGRQIDLYGTWDVPLNLFAYRLVFLEHFWRE